jgi:hypothetical protein
MLSDKDGATLREMLLHEDLPPLRMVIAQELASGEPSP